MNGVEAAAVDVAKRVAFTTICESMNTGAPATAEVESFGYVISVSVKRAPSPEDRLRERLAYAGWGSILIEHTISTIYQAGLRLDFEEQVCLNRSQVSSSR
jgi:hypothetical protein